MGFYTRPHFRLLSILGTSAGHRTASRLLGLVLLVLLAAVAAPAAAGNAECVDVPDGAPCGFDAECMGECQQGVCEFFVSDGNTCGVGDPECPAMCSSGMCDFNASDGNTCGGDPECSGMCAETTCDFSGSIGMTCTDADPDDCNVAACDGAGMCDPMAMPEPAGAMCPDTDPNDCGMAACDGAGVCDPIFAPEPPGTSCTDLDESLCTIAACDDMGMCDQASAQACDLGDAPDPTYPTLLVSSGAHHLITSLTLGASIDAEADGQPNPTATGDDLAGSDDEDGVTFPNPLVLGAATTVSVTASGPGTLDYFFDFDANGTFGNTASEIFTFAHPGGASSVPVTVPAGAVPGATFARFRLSTAGVMGPGGGPAADGEVEDYAVTIVAEASADLAISKSDSVDPVIAGNTLVYTIEVNNNGPSDATGVVVTDTLPAGVTLVSSSGCAEDPAGVPTCTLGTIASGGMASYTVTVTIDQTTPSGVITNTASVSSDVTDPNVENDSIGENTFVQSLDFGDAPDSILDETAFRAGPSPGVPTAGYQTLLANNGARHLLGSGLFLGAVVDSDPDGWQSADATGDDADSDGDPGDDEDGVTFDTALVRGYTTGVTVVASGSGYLSAWVDFNANGSWLDPGEQIFVDVFLSAGATSLSFPVPPDPTVGTTFARFRFSSGGNGQGSSGDNLTQVSLGPDGFAPDGEVEDYQVEIVRPGIGDTVWCDAAMRNGMFDAGEGIPGVLVELFSDADCSNTVDEGDSLIDSTSTTGDGFYLFDSDPGSESDLPVGTIAEPVCYRVSVDTTDPDLGACTAPITPVRYFPDLTDVEPRSLENDFGFDEPSDATFTKTFVPATIGPGSVSMLVFDIANPESASPLEELAFTDTLPAGLTIASPPAVSNSCGGTVSATAGDSAIVFDGGAVGANGTCSITVNVTSSTPGMHVNSVTLSTSEGSSGPAMATLTVATNRPGFSKGFAPSTVFLGGRSTLTFTIDNTANGSNITQAEFFDTFPIGMVVADPAQASTTCGGGLQTLTAGPGADGVSFFALGTNSPGFAVLPAGATCTVSVDVIATVAGDLGNVSGELATAPGNLSSGKASAVLVSTATELGISKSFTDDPVPPGGTVTLEFTLVNRNRDFTATGITFTDDLKFTPSTMLVATGGPTPDPPCGAGSTLTGTDVLTLSGGTLAPGGSCTFSVSLSVPAGETLGAHENATSAVTGTIDGSPVVGNVAKEILVVDLFPIFTKEFIDDPAGAGGTVTLRFTLTNPSAEPFSDIAFTDDLNSAIPGLAANGLVAASGLEPEPLVDPCGTGSELTVPDPNDSLPSPPFPELPPDPTMLIFSGGSLAPAGMTGDSCTFDVVLDIPSGTPAGTYTNTTSEIAFVAGFCDQLGAAGGTLDVESVCEPRTGPPASGDLEVVGAPRLTKDFTNDPALAGGTVTLEFTLEHDPGAPGDATAIQFTDDLVGTTGLTGLAANDLPKMDVCGAGSEISGTTNLSFTGGTLVPGETCTFSVTLDVPAGASPGTYQNETSNVVAMVSGVSTVGGQAQADLVVGGLTLVKDFTDDPVIAGGTVTLEFTIVNQTPNPMTSIFFEDVLDPDVLDGLAVAGPLPTDPCGVGSTLTTFSGAGVVQGLRFAGGSLPPSSGPEGSECSFSVTLLVPATTPSDTYRNQTRLFQAFVGDLPAIVVDPTSGSQVFFPNATADLVVGNEDLLLTKEFTDDPVVPGGAVTLEFTLSSLSSDSAADLAFTDDLAAALAGLEAMPPLDTGTCGGTLTGTSLLDYSGGSFASGECSFSVTVKVPAAVPFGTTITNTTSGVTGTVGGLPVTGDPASDDLVIDFFEFSKVFDPSLTKPTGAPSLRFTIKNLSTMDSVNDLAFTDNLNDVITGLMATSLPINPCGPGSTISGTSLLAFSNGNLLPGGSCTFDVPLAVPADSGGGTFLNATSQLSQNGLPVSSAATALLTVDPPPALFKVFLPDFIVPSGRSALTFLIDNSASGFAVTDIAVTDNLPPGITVATSPDIGTDCAGATISAVTGASVVSVSGGQLPAGGDCLVQVDVTGSTPGSYVNTTAPMTSSSGTSAAASDTLVIVMPGDCSAPDGENLTLQDDTVVGVEEFIVCNTITVGPNYTVVGPDGNLTLRAGVAVVFGDGFAVSEDGKLRVSIEPVLIP